MLVARGEHPRAVEFAVKTFWGLMTVHGRFEPGRLFFGALLLVLFIASLALAWRLRDVPLRARVGDHGATVWSVSRASTGCAVCASSARSFVVEEVFVWQPEP